MRRFSYLLMIFALASSASAQDWPDRTTLPPFEGKTYGESESAWQNPVSAPEGAPNVIVNLLDDVKVFV